MAGRGGRGTFLQLALAKQKECEGDTSLAPGLNSTSTPACLGRGNINVPVVPVASVMPFGRGRGLGLIATITPDDPAAIPLSTSLGIGRGNLVVRGAGEVASVDSSATQSSAHLASEIENMRISDEGGRIQKTAHSGDEPSQKERRPRVTGARTEIMHASMGKNDKAVGLCVNYINVICSTETVEQYCVDFRPYVDSRIMRIRMMKELRSEYLGVKEARVFDGRILFLPFKLPNQETIFEIPKPTSNEIIRIIVRHTNTSPLLSCPAVYNIIFRNIQSFLKMTQVGRNYYLPTKSTKVPQHKLELWPGYTTAIAVYEGGLKLLIDVDHKVIRSSTVYEIMADISGRQPNVQQCQAAMIEAVVGATVLTRYNNRTMRVDDIMFDSNCQSSFERDGDKISFADYYKNNYGIAIKDLGQPLLLSRVKKMVQPRQKSAISEDAERMLCLVPELCYLTGLTDSMRSDIRLMKDVHAVAKVNPSQRQKSIVEFVNAVYEKPEAVALLNAWGMSLERDVCHLTGRQMAPETIVFGGGKTFECDDRAEFKNGFSRFPVISGIHVQHWVLVCTQRDSAKVNDFVQCMIRCAQTMNIIFGPPQVLCISSDNTQTYLKSVKASFVENQTQLIACVFPTQREDRYNALKQLCCCDIVVPSQFMLIRTISDPKKQRSVAANIAAQINAKLGGELWAIKIPISNFMAIGIDTYHSGKGRARSSYGALVGSLNSQCTRWFSKAFKHSEGEELLKNLTAGFIALLKSYYDFNNVLPNVIFVYRDGVGDSQMGHCQAIEVNSLLQGMTTFGSDYKPKLVHQVVQKRINTRLFRKGGNGLDNPAPGTVLDHTVTRANVYDFFMVPQTTRQGTINPTHYTVLHDTSGYSADKVQRMAFIQCHLYYNWQGTIRVPAPCQYAHRLAQFVGQNLNRAPSEKLSTLLYSL